ncbi:Putative Arf GTPase activating protein [Septoria linicola]|uniref:Arf GTPase activating protein n=1 Tax=Septoria linicola TaxID=215465 RepID=A0A9Q9AE03_9PEZI|nr:putative Arf GTPase activating protein [Septoria linicola]USW47227.1 Putative Arf GTPase activating protein [Septoria linicola]
MSRRTAGPDKAEQNRATLKQLVKLETNKSCADCKRNKHPRWASWNLGIFICIRCSGIHRGMGTHISRVKSVDLDSWTEEQMASMLKWGNGRANKYWEHKLAEGHVPNEAKIENFIRTKYDSKRWVMDGPIPDPSTLSDGNADDDVPLNVVQQQVKERERSASIRNGQATGSLAGPPRAQQPQMDLFGDMSEPAAQPARPSTTEPSINRPGPPKAPVAVPKQTKPGESLLGLDFFGGTQSAAPARPSSTGPNAGVSGRSDLKQSILSLYASKPAAPPPQPAANAFSGMSSPWASPTQQQPQSNAQVLGGLDDAFGSLSFSSPPQQTKPAPFSNFSAPTGHSRQASAQKTSNLSGGSFFDAKPAPPLKQTSPLASPPIQPMASTRQPSNSFGADFGDFSSASPVSSAKSPPPAASSMGDLFDMGAPAPPPKPAATSKPPPISAANFSAFNLSQQSAAPAPTPKPTQTTSVSNFASSNVWDSNDAWATPDPEPAKPAPVTQATVTPMAPKPTPAPVMTSSAFDSGWGDPEPAKPANTSTSAGGFSVQQDEEFGGWSHASPVATTPGPAKGSGGMGNSDDLFGNVWG